MTAEAVARAVDRVIEAQERGHGGGVRARLQIGALGTVTGNTRVVRNRGRTVLEVPANPVLRSTPSAGSGPGVTHSAVLASTVRDALRVGHVIER